MKNEAKPTPTPDYYCQQRQRQCKRCGHEWFQRGPRLPVVCPHCRTPWWNIERRVK